MKLADCMQRLVGPGVQPRRPASHKLDPQLAPLQVLQVDVGDLELAPRRGLEVRRYVEHRLS